LYSYDHCRVQKKHNSDLIHPAVLKYNKTLDWRQIKAEYKNKFVNPIHFLKRVARISSFTIRTVQIAIFNKKSLRWFMDQLIKKLIPCLAWN
jgi:hypothetical protein